MTNIDHLLEELEIESSISREVQVLLRSFFGRMRLTNDISEADMAILMREMSTLDFSAESSSVDTDFLSGKFERCAPSLIAEGAIIGAMDGSISSKDLKKILYIFCRVHDATEIKTGDPC